MNRPKLKGIKMLESLLSDTDGGVRTPASDEEVEVLLQAANKINQLCADLVHLPEDMAEKRDALLRDIYRAVDRYYDRLL